MQLQRLFHRAWRLVFPKMYDVAHGLTWYGRAVLQHNNITLRVATDAEKRMQAPDEKLGS